MKKASLICLIYCVCSTGSAVAFENQVIAGLGHSESSEDYEEDSGFTAGGDETQDTIFASYLHFLSPVEDSGEPLDLLPFFFSRSNYVFVDYYSGDREFELDDSDYESDRDWTALGLGGLFFITPDTAVGGGFFTEDGDWEDNDAVQDDTYDEDIDGWHIVATHYLNKFNRLLIRLSGSDRERDFANGFERNDTFRWLVLGYDGVLGESSTYFVGADIGKGSRERDDSNDNEQDHDLTRLGITVGPVYRNLALYFSWDYYEWDPDGDGWEAEETIYTISPRYWFTERLMLGGSLSYWSWDESGDFYDFEESGRSIQLMLGFRF